MAQMVKNLPAMQKTRVQSLGREDPLEKGMAIHSSILIRRILLTEEPGRLPFMGSQRGDKMERLTRSLSPLTGYGVKRFRFEFKSAHPWGR